MDLLSGIPGTTDSYTASPIYPKVRETTGPVFPGVTLAIEIASLNQAKGTPASYVEVRMSGLLVVESFLHPLKTMKADAMNSSGLILIFMIIVLEVNKFRLLIVI